MAPDETTGPNPYRTRRVGWFDDESKNFIWSGAVEIYARAVEDGRGRGFAFICNGVGE